MHKIIGVTDLQRRFKSLLDGEILRRLRRVRARMAEATVDVSEEEVATEVAAARAELDA